MPHRRAFLQLATLTSLVTTPFALHAQDDFPSRPIRLFVTFGPGSGPDTLARAIAPEMGKALGQSVVIDNRPAGGGNVAAQQLLQEKHDGHTLILATDSLFTMNPYLLPKAGFDLDRDFTLVAPVAEAPVFLVAHPSLNVSTAKELAALVKANPGKYSYFAPTGTPHHLLGERFTEANDLKWVRVSYRDPQQAINEMLGGLVPVGFSSYGLISGSANAGKLRIIGVSSASRMEAMPAVPTLAESVGGMEEAGWFAIYTPSGTPRPVVDKIAQAVVRARDTVEVRQRLDQFGMRTLSTDARAFSQRVKSDYARRGQIITSRGIKMD